VNLAACSNIDTACRTVPRLTQVGWTVAAPREASLLRHTARPGSSPPPGTAYLAGVRNPLDDQTSLTD
jgi:hypothetical protein